MGKIPLILVVSRKDVALILVVRMPYLQTAKKVIDGLLLALLSGVGFVTMQVPSNERSISQS